MKKFEHFKLLASLLAVALVSFLSRCDNEKVNPEIPSVFKIAQLTNQGARGIRVNVSVQKYDSKLVREHGFVWGENPSPTVDNNKYTYSINKPANYEHTILNLKVNSTYYFRAYILNVDNTISYSDEVSLKTLIHEILSFSPTAASSGMEITIEGSYFEPGITMVYLNDIKVDSILVEPSSIKFLVPFGLQADSLNITVEMEGVKLTFPAKLKYQKGRWTKVRSLSDDPDYFNRFLFSIESQGKGYVKGTFGSINSIYEYDPQTDLWTIVAESPQDEGYSRWFVVDSQIYSVRGDGIGGEPSVFMFDLLANEFYEMPPFPRGNWLAIAGITFSIGDAGYAGLGLNSRELWRFKPSVSTSTWERKSDFPGTAFKEALALSNSESAYIIGGSDAVNYSNETWEYDPLNDSWERKADYPGQGRTHLTGFVINDKLYVGSGLDVEGKSNKDFWEYDPTTDNWVRVADFISPRYLMYSFSLDNNGYSGAGFESVCDGCGGHKVFYDLWKFELQ